MQTALVIDTCGAEGYVGAIALAGSTPELLSERRLGVRATQEELLPAIGAVLSDAALPLHHLAAVAVLRGPGSFTGVRIGLAAAKGLCEAARLPLVALSRLEVLAEAAGERLAWAWLQAGRGEVYAARAARDSHAGSHPALRGPEPNSSSAAVLSLDRAVEAAGQEPVAVCEEALQSAAPHTIFVDANAFSVALRRSAGEAVRREAWADVALTDALYLRVPDAELALRAKQGLRLG